LVGDLSTERILSYFLLLVPIWWIWIGSTYYNERFESEWLENRLMFLLLMFPLVGLAVFIPDGMGDGSTWVAISYAAGRAIITVLCCRAALLVPEFRPTGRIYVAGFSLSIALFVVSVFVPPPLRFVLWGAGLLSDMVTPWLTLKSQQRLPRFSTSKLPERFGLLIIIVLGEAVVGVVNGLAKGHELSANLIIPALLGATVGFFLWWIYFDFVARRPAKQRLLSSIFWSYLHLPLAMGIASTGAGISRILMHAGEEGGHGARELVGFSAAATLIVIGFLELTLQREEDEPTHQFISPIMKIVSGMALILFSLLVKDISGTLLLAVILVVLLIQAGYGVWVWFGGDER
jgi:low temperature requirement protein LtrA